MSSELGFRRGVAVAGVETSPMIGLRFDQSFWRTKGRGERKFVWESQMRSIFAFEVSEMAKNCKRREKRSGVGGERK